MESFYQRVTGRRHLSSAGLHEDATHWMSSKSEGASHQRWGSEPRDEPVVIVSGRSRSRTMNSGMSFYATSNSDSSPPSSRAVSPHLTRDGQGSTLARRENPARNVLSKRGRILRTHGNKFSLSSLRTNDSDTSERYDSARPVTARNAKDYQSSIETIKREELKRTISEPFDFQHVTHTDRVFLKSMERVPKTELVGEFSALRFGQASKPELRGIRADAIPPPKPSESAPSSPVINSEMDMDSPLPRTPPGPAPPPKDEAGPMSPAHCIRTSRSVESFSRPDSSSIVSPTQITPPRRYSSRRALQTSLTAHIHSLGPYIHSPSHSIDAHGVDSIEDICLNCKGMDDAEHKALPELPTTHALTTSDDSARHLRSAPLPRGPMDLADVPEEDESRRQSAIEHQLLLPAKYSVPIEVFSHVDAEAASTNTAQEKMANSSSDCTFVVDDWDDAIDDSWDYATDSDAVASQQPSSMSAQVAKFVDKAITRFSGPEQVVTGPDAKETLVNSPSPELTRSSSQPSPLGLFTSDLSHSRRSESLPLLGLGIELPQDGPLGPDLCTTPTPAFATIAPEANSRGLSMADSFSSDISAASRISKCSSQESIIWSIASSIIGTQRSSNSSNSSVQGIFMRTTETSQPKSSPWTSHIPRGSNLISVPEVL